MSKTVSGRRQFIGGMLAAGFIPKPTWADAGSPAFLSAAARPDGAYILCGIGQDLSIKFQLPLPARGHAAAAHPKRPEAVAFARRPGTFAVVIDCVTGQQKAVLSSPEGRHFYGHGAFSANGDLLFTTENDFEVGRGCIGVWNVKNRYTRVDEWDSGGVGPHDIKRLLGTDILVVANGGIDTHPDTGRTKLNIPTMQPNLTYIENGRVLDTVSLPDGMHKNSIRHLALSRDGTVAFGMQWQGEGDAPALVGTHRRGSPITLMQSLPDQLRDMDGYVGSIACSRDGQSIAVTSPRGGIVQIYDARSLKLSKAIPLEDVCGVTMIGPSFTVTSGTGEMRHIGLRQAQAIHQSDLMWDNHLVPVMPSFG